MLVGGAVQFAAAVGEGVHVVGKTYFAAPTAVGKPSVGPFVLD